MIVRNSEMKKKTPSRAQPDEAAIAAPGKDQIGPQSSKGAGRSRKPRKAASGKKASTAAAAATDQTGKAAKPKQPKKPKSDGARRDTKSKSKGPASSQPEASAPVALKQARAKVEDSKPAKRRARSPAARQEAASKSTTSPTEKNPQTRAPQPQPSVAKKRLSFFAWLFRKRDSSPAPEDAYDNIIQIAAAKFVEASPANGMDDAPIKPAPRLMAKLSGLGDDAPEMESDGALTYPDNAGENEPQESDLTGEPAEGETEDAGEPGPLTLRLLEFQRKMEPTTPKIRSFP